MGHQVTVLTGFPNHPDGRVYQGYRKRFLRLTSTEQDGGVRVVRTAHFVRPNKGSFNRAISYSSFTVCAAVKSVPIRNVDVVIGTVPQPLHALAGWFKARLSKSPFVLEVRDLWPESIVGTGQSSENSMSYRILGKVARFLYSKADAHVAVTDAIREWTIENYGVNRSNSTVIPAGVDSEFFQAAEKPFRPLTSMGKPPSFVVTYAGTIGNAQGIEVVLDAAEIAGQTHPQIVFSIVGSGAESGRLRKIADNQKITNVTFTGQVPRHQMPNILAGADLCLAVLRDSQVFRTAVPTKLYEYMAAGKPVITNVAGEAARLVDRSGCGIVVPPGDAISLSRAVIELHDDPDRRRQLGQAGQKYVETEARWQSRAEAYEATMLDAVERRKRVKSG